MVQIIVAMQKNITCVNVWDLSQPASNRCVYACVIKPQFSWAYYWWILHTHLDLVLCTPWLSRSLNVWQHRFFPFHFEPNALLYSVGFIRVNPVTWSVLRVWKRPSWFLCRSLHSYEHSTLGPLGICTQLHLLLSCTFTQLSSFVVFMHSVNMIAIKVTVKCLKEVFLQSLPSCVK